MAGPEQPAPSFPPAGGGGAPGPAQTARDATVSLVLGLLGILLCPLVLSVPAIIFGRRARREISTTGAGGDSMATAGIVLGWVGVALGVLGVLAIVALGLFGLSVTSD